MFVSSKCGLPHQTHTVLRSLLLWSPTPALASNIYNLFTSNPSPQVPFSFSHVPLSLTSQLTTQACYIWYSNAATTFETNPYPQQYHLHVHFTASLQQANISISVRFLKTFFLMFYKSLTYS